MNSVLNEDASMLILSQLNDSELQKIYVSGMIPCLSSILEKNQFWYVRIESLSGRRIDYSLEVNWRETYYILNRELTKNVPCFWNEEDNITVSRILLSMNYIPHHNNLDEAITSGSVNTVHFLITEGGIDPSSVAQQGYLPPLSLALNELQPDILKILLADPRIDVYAESRTQHPILSQACLSFQQEELEEILKILLADPRIDPTYNNSECISLLLR